MAIIARRKQTQGGLAGWAEASGPATDDPSHHSYLGAGRRGNGAAEIDAFIEL